ncbi:MAG TPA: type II toxin-antitoxin system Phd/YefM family antitoxin [Candidatus Baltobacteraceae bacterium]
MKTVKIHEAKTHLSRLVRAISQGSEREIIIAIGDRPVAKLVAIGEQPRRELGMDRGLVKIAPDFDSPELNAEITALFEGE